jgi:hypothetical protein
LPTDKAPVGRTLQQSQKRIFIRHLSDMPHLQMIISRYRCDFEQKFI